MKMRCETTFRKVGQALALCSFTVAAMTACSPDEAEPATAENTSTAADTTTQATTQPATPAANNTTGSQADEADVYRQIAKYVAFNIAPRLAAPNSQLTPQVKELLSMMSAMYDKEKANGATPTELTNLAWVIGEMRKAYGAWGPALSEFDKALAHFAEMGAEEQKGIEAQAALCSIYLSQAVCHMQTGKRDQAKACLAKRLQVAEEQAKQLPNLQEGESKQISQEEFATYAAITQILFSSLRLEAEMMSNEDPEEAADRYEQAIVRAKKLLWCQHPNVVKEYLDLLISASNHEIRINRHQQATAHLDELITIYENSAKQAEKKPNLQAAINKKVEELKAVRTQIQSGNTEGVGEIRADETTAPAADAEQAAPLPTPAQ